MIEQALRPILSGRLRCRPGST